MVSCSFFLKDLKNFFSILFKYYNPSGVNYLYIDFSILNNVIRDIETYELINRFNEVTPIFKAVISQDENGNDFINLRVEKKYVNADKEALCTISYAIEELQKASFVEFLNSLKK